MKKEGSLHWRTDRNTVVIKCRVCEKEFRIPKCRVGIVKSCSKDCVEESKRRTIERNTRPCKSCGQIFLARNDRIKYCSQKCNPSCRLAQTPEGIARMHAGLMKMFEEGRNPKGEQCHQWNGGRSASRERQHQKGNTRRQCREYRKAHPERVKEWSKRRAGYKNKLPKLPHGTIQRLRVLQKDRCANCLKSISNGFHVDHIKPLANGGLHEPLNLQLLCGPCNVRKWKFDPIEFAQKQGRLL